jgi:hypothetical protein
MNDEYIGIIELQNHLGEYHTFTILKDNKGYKAVSPTNNGYFTLLEGYETLTDIYTKLADSIEQETK